MSRDDMDMSLNDLTEFLFLKNYTNKQIGISLNGIDTSRDLFCFCLDILCKGLVLLFGKDNKVVLQDLSYDDFNKVNEKMKCMGIRCHLETFEVETPQETIIDLWTQNVLNIHRIHTSNENLKLEEYHFDIQTKEFIYRIRFELIHNINDRPQTL
jgi:hypothetical protein